MAGAAGRVRATIHVIAAQCSRPHTARVRQRRSVASRGAEIGVGAVPPTTARLDIPSRVISCQATVCLDTELRHMAGTATACSARISNADVHRRHPLRLPRRARWK